MAPPPIGIDILTDYRWQTPSPHRFITRKADPRSEPPSRPSVPQDAPLDHDVRQLERGRQHPPPSNSSSSQRQRQFAQTPRFSLRPSSTQRREDRPPPVASSPPSVSRASYSKDSDSRWGDGVGPETESEDEGDREVGEGIGGDVVESMEKGRGSGDGEGEMRLGVEAGRESKRRRIAPPHRAMAPQPMTGRTKDEAHIAADGDTSDSEDEPTSHNRTSPGPEHHDLPSSPLHPRHSHPLRLMSHLPPPPPPPPAPSSRPTPRFIFPTPNQHSPSTTTTTTRPPLILPAIPQTTDPPASPLPEAFSPHRRGHRFTGGGMASEVREWVVNRSQAASRNRGQSRNGDGQERAYAVTTRVADVRSAGTVVTLLRSTGDKRILLTAPPTTASTTTVVERRQTGAVQEGSVVGIKEPAWMVTVGGEEWLVGVEWGILEG
ncbi:MAG: hypothetical protein M1827_004213 [Pycnora praestabilis]|nr:MAG: hypothetical protein M1827_004213 [Pycnora praestabilis]